jgi:membrane protease subunit HflC
MKSCGVIVAILIVLGVIIGRTTIYVVDARELAVILQFGKPVRSITEPGLYFKLPFVQEVRRLPATLQVWSSTEDIVDLPTADGKKVEVSSWAVWRIKDPLKFVQALRTVENGQLTVKDRVRAAIRDEITRYDLAEVVRNSNRQLSYSFQFVLAAEGEISGDGSAGDRPKPAQPADPDARQRIRVGREKIVRSIRDSVKRRLEGAEAGELDRGVELVDVDLTNVGFVPAVRDAAFDRLIEFMASIASGYTSYGEQRKQEIINQTQAEVEEILGNGEQQSSIIRGQADAEIIQKYAAAINETGDLYMFLKQLELYQKSLNNKTRLILTTDSQLFRMLQEVDAAKSTPSAASASSK